MKLAIIDQTSNRVENTIIAPNEGAEWTPPGGFIAVASETATIGDLYDPASGTFSSPYNGDQVEIDAAYIAALAAFESLPLGKQALWESVRQAVASAIQAGDFTKARNILETVPPLYEGAEDDRAVFLSIFPAE